MLGLLVIAIQFHFTFLERKGRIKGGREEIWQFEGVTPVDLDIFVDSEWIWEHLEAVPHSVFGVSSHVFKLSLSHWMILIIPTVIYLNQNFSPIPN